jgi:type IV secretory pathway VirB3-like protein
VTTTTTIPGVTKSDRAELARRARVAGLLYLVAIVLGPFSLIYVPNVIVVTGNAGATADNIRSHEMLFRLGIVGDVLTGTVFLFVVLALYRLLKDVDRNLAAVMIILGGIVPLPIFCINAMNWIAALLIVHGVGYASSFSQDQQNALAMLFMQLHHQGNIVNSMFWGLWLLPFGALVIKSRFLPRLLGIWLLVNGVAYLATSSVGLLFPSNLEVVENVTQPALFGEIAIMLWLIIMGAREKPTASGRGATEPR